MNDSQIKVSVIVTTYNHERYIAQALDSILKQEVDFGYEILVGDDASTDNTKNILSSYAEKFPERVKVFFRNKNIGASQNAYDLLYRASGDYLAFCEGDDYWTAKEKMAVQYAFLEARHDLIGCAHRCVVVDECGTPLKNQEITWVREKTQFSLQDFQGIYLPGQTATIMKRNVFRDNSADVSFLYKANRNISDRTATLLYLTKGNFGFIPCAMSAYRRVQKNSGSQTDYLYSSKSDAIKMELSYTERLEEIAAMLGVKESKSLFLPHYQRLYASAVFSYFRNPSPEWGKAIARIGRHFGKGNVHPMAFLSGVTRKLT